MWFATSAFERIQKLWSEQLGVAPEKITPQTSFADLGSDSLEVVEIVMELEEEFDLSIPEKEAEDIQNVEDAIRYLQRRIRKP
ncbi:acyl carrier protein [Aeoliella mucimassa]|uniref:acyl carrier protein n=1 Tax=Aeoliella mucimassa TaxID=2527972 RepID=UPI001E5F388C|nr:acyl carrier protein [Aeoliella mucimassa]